MEHWKIWVVYAIAIIGASFVFWRGRGTINSNVAVLIPAIAALLPPFISFSWIDLPHLSNQIKCKCGYFFAMGAAVFTLPEKIVPILFCVPEPMSGLCRNGFIEGRNTKANWEKKFYTIS